MCLRPHRVVIVPKSPVLSFYLTLSPADLSQDLTKAMARVESAVLELFQVLATAHHGLDDPPGYPLEVETCYCVLVFLPSEVLDITASFASWPSSISPKMTWHNEAWLGTIFRPFARQIPLPIVPNSRSGTPSRSGLFHLIRYFFFYESGVPYADTCPSCWSVNWSSAHLRPGSMSVEEVPASLTSTPVLHPYVAIATQDDVWILQVLQRLSSSPNNGSVVMKTITFWKSRIANRGDRPAALEQIRLGHTQALEGGHKRLRRYNEKVAEDESNSCMVLS